MRELEGRLRQKESLEEEYKKRKSALEGEIAKLRKEVEIISQQKETMKYVFEKRGLTWEQGLALLQKVVSLRAEEAQCRVMVEGLSRIANAKKKEIAEVEPVLKRLRQRQMEEQKTIKNLERYRFEQERWLNIALPALKEEEQRLLSEVHKLETARTHLKKEFKHIKAFIGEFNV